MKYDYILEISHKSVSLLLLDQYRKYYLYAQKGPDNVYNAWIFFIPRKL